MIKLIEGNFIGPKGFNLDHNIEALDIRATLILGKEINFIPLARLNIPGYNVSGYILPSPDSRFTLASIRYDPEASKHDRMGISVVVYKHPQEKELYEAIVKVLALNGNGQ